MIQHEILIGEEEENKELNLAVLLEENDVPQKILSGNPTNILIKICDWNSDGRGKHRIGTKIVLSFDNDTRKSVINKNITNPK